MIESPRIRELCHRMTAIEGRVDNLRSAWGASSTHVEWSGVRGIPVARALVAYHRPEDREAALERLLLQACALLEQWIEHHLLSSPWWFVITRSPKDFPGKFVGRRWLSTGREHLAIVNDPVVGDSLTSVREQVPELLFCERVRRGANNDPVIVETWIK